MQTRAVSLYIVDVQRPFRPSAGADSEAREADHLTAKPAGVAEAGELLKRDYSRLTTVAAFADLPSLSILEASGPDTTTFLQGMLTNDVSKLLRDEGCLAALLTPIGKIISDLIALKLDNDRFWLVVRRDLNQKVEQALNRFIVSDEVELRGLEGWSALAVLGPLSRERLAALVPGLPEKPLSSIELEVQGDPVRVLRHGRLGVDSYHLWVPAARHTHWMSLLKAACGLEPVSPEILEVLRVEAGVPEYGIDFDESNIPLESNLDALIDFNKGCYIGQEIVARVTNLGQVSRKLVGLAVQGACIPARGDEVRLQDLVIGRITSATRSLALNQPIALGYIQRKYLVYGSEVDLSSGSRATVQELPFTF